MQVLTPGEVAGRGGREDLRHGLLEEVGREPVVIDKITALRERVAGAGGNCPGVILARVVHHEVEAHGDAALVARLREPGEIGHRANLGLDPAKIRDGIAAVAASLGRGQKRHQVQIVHAARLDVVKLLLHAPERSGKGFDIHEHTDEVMPLVPVGIVEPLAVDASQLLAALRPHAPEHFGEVFIRRRISVIELQIERAQLPLVPLKAAEKFSASGLLVHGCRSSGMLIEFIISEAGAQIKIVLAQRSDSMLH